MKLLIDGYNLIPAIPGLGKLLRRDLQAGRKELLRMLRAYKQSADRPVFITVVFDGKGDPGLPSGGRTGGIEVRFSRNEIADDLILRLLRKEKRGATLVTSDRALGAAARESAGAVLRSGEFARRLCGKVQDAPPPGEERPEDPPPRRRTVSTKKKGNPRRLSKKDRRRKKILDRL